jgi:hypothetical protein
MEPVQKVSVVLDMHPEDYRRMREAADNAGLPEGEFCGLAIHRGIDALSDLTRDPFRFGGVPVGSKAG